MQGIIRLAEARGILSDGRPLNPVQQASLELLVIDRIRKSNDAKVDDLKLSLLTADPQMGPSLYPDWFPAKDSDSDVEEALSSDGPTEYDLTGGPGEIEDVEALIAKISAGTMGLSQDNEQSEWM